MFLEFQIARAIHAEREAQYNKAEVVEGMTIEVPNIVDRVVLAVRAALAKLLRRRSRTAYHGSRAVAK